MAADATLPATTGWLLRGKDGRLSAYSPVDQALLRWTEARPGGPEWTGPDRLEARGMLPYLSISQSAEGYVHLMGVRRRPRTDGPDDIDFAYAIQFQTGRPLRDWLPLSNPHGKDRAKAVQVGLPSAVLDSTGGMQLFVRNTDGALSVRRQNPTGGWRGWGRVLAEGTPATGEAAAAVAGHGAVDVVVPAEGTLLRWHRPAADKPLIRDTDEPAANVVPGTITVERTSAEGLTHFWRDAGDGAIRAWRPGTEPAVLAGRGTGPVALLRTPVDGFDCTILAQRGLDGRPTIAAYPTEEESVGLNWTPTGEPCVGAPALALDAEGRVVLAAIGLDGTLRVARQKAEQGLALAAWTRF